MRIYEKRNIIKMIFIFVFPVFFFFWTYLSLLTGRIGNSHAVSTGFIEKHFKTEKVGCFQSGVIGFFNNNVINLDGKINQEALKYSINKNLSGYIDKEDINVMVDWQYYIYNRVDNKWLKDNWQDYQYPVPNDKSICLVRNKSKLKN